MGSRARYGDATSVIDQVRLAGIQNVGIITDQRQPTPRQNPAAATGIPVWVSFRFRRLPGRSALTDAIRGKKKLASE